MIVTRLDEIIGTERDARGDVWASRRFLVASDNVGFTLTETTVEAGADLTLWYKHHIEANYVIEGEGEVENAETGEVYPLAPGTTYTLDKNDKHHLRAFSRLKLVCVFTPALSGDEVHDKNGAYTLPE
ncbi:MAG: ectoine synthase [Granulosicoccus sp.]|nr:ectoine synthase [Granulosicoccus sp.]